MRPQKRAFAIVFGTVFAALCTVGCNKASSQRSGSAGEPGERASVTETTSAQMEGRPGDEGAASTRRDDYLSVVRREQLQLRARLQEAIVSTDRNISELRSRSKDAKPSGRDTIRMSELQARRQHLEMSSRIVERSDERGWDELKATIERDLEPTLHP